MNSRARWLAFGSALVTAAIGLACVVSPSGGGTTDGGSSGETGTQVVGRSCTFACSTASDCNAATGLPADDFACVSGACQNLGCQSDSECMAAMGSGYVCRQYNGLPPGCTAACTSSSDCANTYSGVYAADELACVSGGCMYVGCQSDSECQSSGAGFVCRAYGSAPANCTRACNSVSDCVGGSGNTYAQDELQCVNGGCRYVGCQSDGECPNSGSGVAGLCR